MPVWIQHFPLNLALRFSFLFFLFFFDFTRFREETKFTVYETNVTVHALFWYYSHTVHRTHSHIIQKKKIKLKMGPMVLFTHLKIILLQYFQFSISATISSIQTVGPPSNVICIFLEIRVSEKMCTCNVV